MMSYRAQLERAMVHVECGRPPHGHVEQELFDGDQPHLWKAVRQRFGVCGYRLCVELDDDLAELFFPLTRRAGLQDMCQTDANTTKKNTHFDRNRPDDTDSVVGGCWEVSGMVVGIVVLRAALGLDHGLHRKVDDMGETSGSC